MANAVFLWMCSYLGEDAYDGNHFRCEMFHSVTDVATKERILTEFTKTASKIRVVIATVAFGMGVNIDDIRLILHWGSAKDTLSYWQEVGRSARDGLPGV